MADVDVMAEASKRLTIAPEKMRAAETYCAALEANGLPVDFAAWTKHEEDDAEVLLITSPMFNYTGPKLMSDLIFKAYHASETFKVIDPFHVMIRSPSEVFYREIDRMNLVRVADTPEGLTAVATFRDEAGIILSHSWVVREAKLRRKKTTQTELSRKWARFERKIEELANAA